MMTVLLSAPLARATGLCCSKNEVIKAEPFCVTDIVKVMAEAARPRLNPTYPLLDGCILRQVFEYVGGGEFYFVASVCKQWKEDYKQAAVTGVDGGPKLEVSRSATLYSAPLASPSRAAVAAGQLKRHIASSMLSARWPVLTT
jgi:hypothetical protein